MRILITGANGQVGRELTESARRWGFPYIACDRARLDIGDSVALEAFFAQQSFDIVINAAAYTAVDAAEADSGNAYLVNRDAVQYLALACRRAAVPLLHLSTDYVFDGANKTAYRETDATHPLSVYGKSKLAGEQALSEILPTHLILRTAWVYSPHGRNFVKTMLRLMQVRDEIGVVSDQWGCPTSARSIAEALMKIVAHIDAAKPFAWGVYHFSGQGRTNWYEFAKEIQRQAGDLLPLHAKITAISTAEYPTAAVRPANAQLACDKLTSAFDIDLADWREELRTMMPTIVHQFEREMPPQAGR